MSTTPSKPASPSWYIVDAKGKTLGRLSTRIADILRGKHRPTWAPHLIADDHVIVTNAAGIVLKGRKMEQKVYKRHTGYFGNMREIPVARLMKERPSDVIVRAVKGMLPRNRLRARMLTHLHVFPATEHPHEAQQPQSLDVVIPVRRTPSHKAV